MRDGKKIARAIAAREARSKETRQGRLQRSKGASRAGYLAALKRTEEERFYISFSVKGSYIEGSRERGIPRWQQYVWPKLFKTRQLAEDAIALLPVFANSAATAQRGRITSVRVEKTRVRS